MLVLSSWLVFWLGAVAATEEDDDDAQWTTGTYTTGYWDCCKPSCSWSGKGSVTNPVRSCEAETGETLDDPDTTSVCDGGTAASCADHQPFDVAEGVTMGFAAAAVGGKSGLNGDENCGECYELRWTAEEFSYGGGAHPDIVGKQHIIQVTNIGYDVTGSHSFDLQIPGAGQGIFTSGCPIQFPGYETEDFDCGNNYGGCDDATGCVDLPDELRPGCEWRYSASYSWKTENGKSDNPYVRFRRVKCPQELVALSGTEPLDDDDYPDYRETKAPTSSPKPTYSPAPTTLPPTRGPTQSGCCFYPPPGSSTDVCAACESFADSTNYCAQSQANCEQCTDTTWCGGSDATVAPYPNPTPKPTPKPSAPPKPTDPEPTTKFPPSPGPTETLAPTHEPTTLKPTSSTLAPTPPRDAGGSSSSSSSSSTGSTTTSKKKTTAASVSLWRTLAILFIALFFVTCALAGCLAHKLHEVRDHFQPTEYTTTNVRKL